MSGQAEQTGPGQPEAAPGPGPTQLEFTQAMTDFKIMFPSMDVDVIEAVLRSNSGAVDSTIDQLLSMAADSEMGGPPDYPNTLPSYREAVQQDGGVDQTAGQLGATSLAGPDLLSSLGAAGGAGPPLHALRGWAPPLLGKLPADFLRVRPAAKQGHSYTHLAHHRERVEPGGPQRSQQLLEDEKFAMMLQNEEFMRELRGNPEFLSALEEEDAAAPAGPERPRDQAGRKSHLGMDDALFREKLKNMGKTSKQKFSKLAAVFSRRGGGAGRVLGHAPAPSKDNLLLHADPVASSGHTDTDSPDSEEEQHSTTKGRKYQLM